MRRASSSRSPRGHGVPAGFTLLEVVVALAIFSLALGAVHLIVGTAIRSKLQVASWVTNQQHGRLMVAWIGDRVRQAGFRAAGTPADPGYAEPRCRDGIVSQDSQYLPTGGQLFVTADVDDDGIPETRGFTQRDGSVWETVLPCTGGVAVQAPLNVPASVELLSLAFRYFDEFGTEMVNPNSPEQIREIRAVEVRVQVRARAGTSGPTTQTWVTRVALRNP